MLLRTITIIKKRLNPKLEMLGVLLTMFDKRNRLSFQVAEEVERHFPDLLLKTRIPRNKNGMDLAAVLTRLDASVDRVALADPAMPVCGK